MRCILLGRVYGAYGRRVLTAWCLQFGVVNGRLAVSGRNNGGSWRYIGSFTFRTSAERFAENGQWISGAKVNSNYPSAPQGGGCDGFSGWYEYEYESTAAYQHYRMVCNRISGPHHCPRVSEVCEDLSLFIPPSHSPRYAPHAPHTTPSRHKSRCQCQPWPCTIIAPDWFNA